MSDGNPKGRGCFFYGCLISAGLGGLFVAAIVGLYFYGAKQLTPYPEKFLTLIDSDDYTGAYALVGDGWKKQMNLQQFTDFEKAVKGVLGPCTAKTMTGVSVNSNTGGTTAVVTFSATFAKGPATLIFTMEKVNDQWLIQGLKYNSDLLKNGLPAPQAETPTETPEAK